MKNLALILPIALFLLASCGNRQNDYLNNTRDFLRAENYKRAQEQIDLASENEAFKDSASTWYLKGYTYYKLYKKGENPEGTERLLAIDYFARSIELEAEGKFTDKCRETIVNLAKSYYNDAVTALGEMDAEKGLASFDIFREKVVLGDPEYDISAKEIDVYLVIGGLYAKECATNELTDPAILNRSAEYFGKVLQIDPNNLNANYNTGILYYNEAVKRILDAESCKQKDVAKAFDWTDPSSVIPTLRDIIGCLEEVDYKKYHIAVQFESALPYLEKALELDPENPNIKIGLEGIRYILESYSA